MPKGSGFLIEHQCPQCGAPATLGETERLFSCPFCRVKSYLFSRDVFRYVLPHKTREGKEIFYFPYWRFKGIHFSSVPGGIRHRIADVSCQAVESVHFPSSLGLRSQTLKLRFVTPETKGSFLKASLPVKKMMESVEDGFTGALPKPIFDQAFIGETLSQIYSPYAIVKGVFYDGVLNRPLNPQPPPDFDISSLPGGPAEGDIQFLPALCPKCGWDLSGEKDTLVLHCKNCTSFFQAGTQEFVEIQVSHLPVDGKGVAFLPFYQIRAEVAGIPLASYSDLVRVANLPKVVQKGWEEMPFSFWSPAFKVRPEDFLQFGRSLTLSQPQKALAPNVPDAPLHPVTLSLKEAVEGLKITLASFMKPPDTMLPILPGIRIVPQKALLVYIPFYAQASELIQPSFQLRISKHMLGFAMHL